MRYFVLIFSSAFIASVFTFVLIEQRASAKAHSAAVVADEEKGIVRVVIDGREIARFDAEGLSVAGRITPASGLVPPAVYGQPLPDQNAKGGAQ